MTIEIVDQLNTIDIDLSNIVISDDSGLLKIKSGIWNSILIKEHEL